MQANMHMGKSASGGLIRNRKIWFFVLPSFIGMAVFFFIPAGASLFYAFTDARGDFVWFANFSDVLSNIALQT